MWYVKLNTGKMYNTQIVNIRKFICLCYQAKHNWKKTNIRDKKVNSIIMKVLFSRKMLILNTCKIKYRSSK